ncbi:MAG: carboxypeptidase-like regulatory domain-containing protein [Bacteroidia bacterium]|nr:carboxypeptidase-like regulatory domain-containing protein [Bacteroidia bacterium]
MFKLLVSLVFIFSFSFSWAQKKESVLIYGKVIDKEKGTVIENVSVRINNSTFGTYTDKKGNFEFLLPKVKHYSLLFQTVGFKKEVREVELDENEDSAKLFVYLKAEIYELDAVPVFAHPKPDTIYGSPKYSIADFNFYEDKYLLLTFTKSMEKTTLRLVDEFKNEITKAEVPEIGGEAKELYQDYMGYTNVICKEGIYRVVIRNDKIKLYELPAQDFNALVRPIIDTAGNNLFFSNYSRNFPLFNYYYYNTKDSTYKPFATVEDKPLMDLYRFEYYFLKPAEKLMAREIADENNIDKHKAAAMMTGFTNSMYYTPLFAPLFVIGDTLHIFDHYKNCLFHYDSQGNKLDSVPISYHHPKNWKDWKNHMVKDLTEGNVFAVYSRDGHKYMKKINYRNGKEEGSYKIIHYSADRIKVKDGYIYYVYRPYESTQEKFLYKERIFLSR